MEKLKSSLTNMVCVLVGVALVTGGLLAVVNNITSGPKAEKAEKSLADGIKAVMGTDDLTVTANDTVKSTDEKGKEQVFIIHKASDKSNNELGAAVESTTMGFGGELKVLVGFDNGGKILGYTVLKHAETPGLGAKADTWFQKGQKGNIIGKKPVLDVKPEKGGKGDVDAITASTITTRAFLKAINQAYDAYAKKATDGNSGATKQNNQKKG